MWVIRMNRKNTVLIILIIVFAIAFIGSAGYLVFKDFNTENTQSNYSNIASSIEEEVDNTESTQAVTGATEVVLVDNPIDFESLIEKNPDIYSWIIVPKTNINYPVLRSATDDNFYLDHNVDKNYSFAGSIYSQFCNKRDFSDRVTVLYGHNMADGSMFADLHKFAKKDFFDKNKYIYVYTPDRKLTYEVVSAFVYDDRHIMNSFDFENDEVFQDYIESVLSPRSISSNVRDGVTLDIDDKLLVLSTCLNYGSGRYLVQGVLVNDEQTK